MAREIQELLWCDRHRGVHSEDVEGSTHTIRIDGVEFEVELCDDCRAELVLPLDDVLSEYGRKVVGQRRATAAAKAYATRSVSEASTLLSPTHDRHVEVNCPKCGKEVQVSSLGSHCRGQHKQSLFEVQQETGIYIVNARRPPTPKVAAKKTAAKRGRS